MKLVLDANIFISSLISTNGKSFELIFNDKLELVTPEFIFQEIEKYKQEILEKSGLSEEEFDLFFSIISSRINIIPLEEFKDLMQESDRLSPDINDSQYFALALKFDCGIWSNDKKLKQQERILVYSTLDLLSLFEQRRL